MIVRVERAVTKLCPFKSERDVGRVVIEYRLEAGGDPIELHWLAGLLDAEADRAVTHEDYTNRIVRLLEDWDVCVTTTWRTAGLEVTVVDGVVPSDGIDPQDS